MLPTVAIKDIIVKDRQRTSINARGLNELAWNIESSCLLQSIGVWRDPDGATHLVWGGRRLAAVTKLAEEKIGIRDAEGDPVPLGEIPVVFFGFDSLIERKDAELAENVEREEIPWQDKAKALAEIHQLRLELNPKQTVTATAEELVAKDAVPTSVRTARLAVSQAVVVAAHMKNDVVAKAKNLNEAFMIVQKQGAQQAEAALIALRKNRDAKAGINVSDPIVLICGEALEEMERIAPRTFDLILCDPPYGIGADASNWGRRHKHAHAYKDDAQTVMDLLPKFLLSAFRVAKDRANLFLFVDVDLFVYTKEAAQRQGWAVFRTPVTWDKRTPGIGPWQTGGFQRQTEWILYATKGKKGLLSPIPDIIAVNRVAKEKRIHAAQKPLELLKTLIRHTTIHGDYILDPFAGSGATLVAAAALGRRALGIEFDKSTYDAANVNVFGEGDDNDQSSGVGRTIPRAKADDFA